VECLITASGKEVHLEYDHDLARLLKSMPIGALVEITYRGPGRRAKPFKVRWKRWQALEETGA